jgi:hypothetical protein
MYTDECEEEIVMLYFNTDKVSLEMFLVVRGFTRYETTLNNGEKAIVYIAKYEDGCPATYAVITVGDDLDDKLVCGYWTPTKNYSDDEFIKAVKENIEDLYDCCTDRQCSIFEMLGIEMDVVKND